VTESLLMWMPPLWLANATMHCNIHWHILNDVTFPDSPIEGVPQCDHESMLSEVKKIINKWVQKKYGDCHDDGNSQDVR
jgi:hypothetical protein